MDRTLLHVLRAEAWSALIDARVSGTGHRHLGAYCLRAYVDPGHKPDTTQVKLIVQVDDEIIEQYAQIVHHQD